MHVLAFSPLTNCTQFAQKITSFKRKRNVRYAIQDASALLMLKLSLIKPHRESVGKKMREMREIKASRTDLLLFKQPMSSEQLLSITHCIHWKKSKSK